MNLKKRNPPSESDLENLLQSGFRYALSLTHDETVAEELLQEACLKMIKAEKSWVKGYLYAVIRNTFIDGYRRDKRYPMESLTLMDGREKDSPDTDSADDEEILAESDALHHALTELRADEREAIYLSAVEGYTAREISGMTRRPRNTILSLLHRARGKLRRILTVHKSEGVL